MGSNLNPWVVLVGSTKKRIHNAVEVGRGGCIYLSNAGATFKGYWITLPIWHSLLEPHPCMTWVEIWLKVCSSWKTEPLETRFSWESSCLFISRDICLTTTQLRESNHVFYYSKMCDYNLFKKSVISQCIEELFFEGAMLIYHPSS